MAFEYVLFIFVRFPTKKEIDYSFLFDIKSPAILLKKIQENKWFLHNKRDPETQTNIEVLFQMKTFKALF